MASKQQEVDVIESWEEIGETDVLENKLKSIIPANNSQSRSNGFTTGAPFKIILTGEDALRTQYVPPEPTVKILKRPTRENQSSGDLKVYQPKKTLQQREQEYAEARLRILGEQTPDKPEDKVSLVQNKQRTSDMDNVIRLPKGPDGTKGFSQRS